MADVTINYRSSSIATMSSSGSVLLDTAGTYCDSDIEVVYVSPGGGGANLQSGAGYSNGTYYPDTGYDGFSEFEVDVPNHYTQADEGKVVSNGALVSQSSLSVTSNGTYDTTLKNSVVVNVLNNVGTATKTLTAAAGYITFDNLAAEPTTFVVISAANLATASAAKAAVCLYDGTNTHGLNVTNTSNQNCMYSSGGYSFSYSNGSLTVISSGADFQANEYKLVYSYNTSSSNIHVDGVQVGSGATSVSFTGLTAEPEYFTVMFTGSFGTSSGYTRTMAVVYDGSSTYGLEMGSGAVASTNWSYTYTSGTLTVSSSSSSAGGYFHQPGYYELCAVYGGGGSTLGTKTITANGTYNASSDGYDGYSQVTANVPNTYSAGDEGKVVSSGALVSQTSQSITQNGTYDTTLKNEVVVNVSGGGSAGWQRPSGWPDYDSLNLASSQVESIYFTYDNTNNDTWIGLYAEGAYTVQRVSISGGNVTVLSSTDVNSGVSFNETIPSGAGDYVSYRIIPQGSGHLTKVFHYNSQPGNNQGKRFNLQTCVEKYGYLPNVTDIATEWAYRGFFTWSDVSITLLGLPANTKLTFAGTYERTNALRNFKTDSTITSDSFSSVGADFDWTKAKMSSNQTTLLKKIMNSTFDKCDLSGTTLGNIASCESFAENCTRAEAIKLPSANYANVTSTTSMFRNCNSLKVIDLPATLACAIGNNFANSCYALQAVVLRADAVVPLGGTGYIINELYQKGGARIFVPSAQLASYKTASNWSTLFATYPDMFGAIEGSAYE